MKLKLVFACVLMCLPLAMNAAELCKVTPDGYSSADGVVLTKVAHIITFTADCPSHVVPAYADVDGQTLTVSKVNENRYQISWNVGVDKASSGTKKITLFNEEGFASYKKSKSLDKVVSSFSYSYSSPYRGPFISSELAALIVGLGLTYLAISNRFKIASKKI